MNFVAIDFETATQRRDSACAVGIVTVRDGLVVEKFSALIRPPRNWYNLDFSRDIHGIFPCHTREVPEFAGVYPEIRARLLGQMVVAHNEHFDREVLAACMERSGLDCGELGGLIVPWECTCRIYREKGFDPVNLHACCERLAIPLNHHDALSDAFACAELYRRRGET